MPWQEAGGGVYLQCLVDVDGNKVIKACPNDFIQLLCLVSHSPSPIAHHTVANSPNTIIHVGFHRFVIMIIALSQLPKSEFVIEVETISLSPSMRLSRDLNGLRSADHVWTTSTITLSIVGTVVVIVVFLLLLDEFLEFGVGVVSWFSLCKGFELLLSELSTLGEMVLVLSNTNRWMISSSRPSNRKVVVEVSHSHQSLLDSSVGFFVHGGNSGDIELLQVSYRYNTDMDIGLTTRSWPTTRRRVSKSQHACARYSA